ncbi:MAG: hypothetical protein KAK00_02690 [Nanoarchaeota archaeon]|nr:hypothetical protein [Nanoarchaeota archaeon]
MEAKEKILSFIRMHGPSLPIVISKHIGADTFFTSAHLSELKELGKIRISHLKIGGGSPLYFLHGQEDKLQNFFGDLGEKERKVYGLLKGKKVLRDSALVPVFRAAIRSIKDFAFPFTVNFKGKKEIFWKWYLLSNQGAEQILRDILGIRKEEKKEKIEEKTGERKEKSVEKIEEKEVKREEQKKLEKQQVKGEEGKKPADIKGSFYGSVNQYFIQNRIRIVEENIIRKSSEIDFIVEVPSPLGDLRYYVKAKSKKKITDGDLSSVFINGQTKRLPVLFLAKGDLTKKAKEMLESEFRGMKFNKI